MIGESLANYWPAFVDCPKRTRSMSEFLSAHVLPRCSGKAVIDLAAGIGCEAALLSRQGYGVVANELSEPLRRVGQEYVRETGRMVTWTTYDWLDIASHFSPAAFDCALLVGNSFCLLADRTAQERAAEAFRLLLRQGGCLVVDERNFRYILRDRASILEGNFRYSGNVMYCGTRVRGVPRVVTDERIEFSYTESSTGKLVGSLAMRPYGPTELPDLFLCAGFRLLAVFSDLTLTESDECDFFTYLLVKT